MNENENTQKILTFVFVFSIAMKIYSDIKTLSLLVPYILNILHTSSSMSLFNYTTQMILTMMAFVDAVIIPAFIVKHFMTKKTISFGPEFMKTLIVLQIYCAFINILRYVFSSLISFV